METNVNPRELEAQVIRLLKVTIEEIFTCDLCDITAKELVDNILSKSEVALTEDGKEELISFINIQLLE